MTTSASAPTYETRTFPTVEPWEVRRRSCSPRGDRVAAAARTAALSPVALVRTESGKVLAASEAEWLVTSRDESESFERGRLGPGERIRGALANRAELIRPDAVPAARAGRTRLSPRSVASVGASTAGRDAAGVEAEVLRRDLVRFGYAADEMKQVVSSLAGGVEPIGSMGDDAAPAFLERRMPVTEYRAPAVRAGDHPPIDRPLREACVRQRAFVGSGDTNGDVSRRRAASVSVRYRALARARSIRWPTTRDWCRTALALDCRPGSSATFRTGCIGGDLRELSGGRARRRDP